MKYSVCKLIFEFFVIRKFLPPSTASSSVNDLFESLNSRLCSTMTLFLQLHWDVLSAIPVQVRKALINFIYETGIPNHILLQHVFSFDFRTLIGCHYLYSCWFNASVCWNPSPFLRSHDESEDYNFDLGSCYSLHLVLYTNASWSQSRTSPIQAQ
jgi:hypothetical protein